MIDLTNFEYPNLSEIEIFKDLVNHGKFEWKVQLAGYEFRMGNLWEHEYRHIARKLNGLDPTAKSRIFPLEVLNLAIIEVTRLSDNYTTSFRVENSRVILRHLLLSLSPFIIDQLYKAYEIGEAKAREEFEKKFQQDIENLNKGFFGQFGSFSES